MTDLQLIHAGKYDFAQRSRQTTHGTFLSLTVSGQEYSRSYTPGGKPYLIGHNDFLSLTPPGCSIDFSYSRKRENFVLICDIPSLAFNEDESAISIAYCDTRIPLLPGKKLETAETLHLRSIFERIIQLKSSPVPANIFIAEQLCGRLLAELAIPDSPSTDKTRQDPAEQLKISLDNDLHFCKSLTAHAHAIGYSPEHLRRCFIHKYNIDPREYRLRRKLDRVFLLLNDRKLSMKEIAGELGMKNVTHLYSFIRQRCGSTPVKLQKKLPI